MDYSFLNGFLVVLLTQHCISQDLPTSNQSSSVVNLQDGQASPQEPEVPITDVVSIMAPSRLKEVQQVMQEASEKAEGHRAEEVLKELLEKVVDAAMGQVEGGGEAKGDEAAVQEAVTEDALGAENGEADTKAEVLEQGVEEEGEGEAMGATGGDTVVGGEQVFAEVGTFKDVAEEGDGVVKGKAVTAAGSTEEATAGVENGHRDGVEIVNEYLRTEVSQVVEETVIALEEMGRDLTTSRTEEEEDISEQAVVSKEKGAAEKETHETEETVVKVALGGEQETVETSDPSLVVASVIEQIEAIGGKEENLVEDTQVDSDDIETTHTVLGEQVEEEEEEVIRENHAEGSEVENKPGPEMVEGVVAGEEVVQGTIVAKAAGRDSEEDSEASEKMVHGEGEQRAREEAHAALETSQGTETENQEVLVISGPASEDGAEAFSEQSPENQAPTQSSSLGGLEEGENSLGDDKSNHGNEIITPTDDLLPHDPAEAQPTLDNVLVQHPVSVMNEPGETNELVEDTATETSKLGLEAWKIGAISAAVLLVVETIVIILYIRKRRNKSSAPALQRACEEGCVEPEEATGGDCSDDTLPADNGDLKQIATLDPPDVTSTHNKEHATAMSDFPSTSTEESADTGPGPDSSQDLRTSML